MELAGIEVVENRATSESAQDARLPRWAMAIWSTTAMIAALHVATGAATGAVLRSRALAIALGPALHLAGDFVPHRDFVNRNADLATGLGGTIVLGLRYGPTHPITLGAVSAAAPDLEHLFPRLLPARAKLFHGRRGWHRTGELTIGAQLLIAAGLIGLLAMTKPRLHGL